MYSPPLLLISLQVVLIEDITAFPIAHNEFHLKRFEKR